MKLTEIIGLPKLKATFLERLNHFTVRASLGKEKILAHLPNSGKLLELLLPGENLILVPKRDGKIPYLVLGVLKKGEPVLLHTHLTNRIISGLIVEGEIPFYRGYKILATELRFRGVRFDFLLQKGGQKILLEIKTCTLFNEKGAMFPDAVTARGKRHLLTLSEAKDEGMSPECLFVVMSKLPDYFFPAYHIDLTFAQAFLAVKDRVKLRAISLAISSSLEEFRFYKSLEIPFARLTELVKDGGLYLLVIELKQEKKIEVGSLGKLYFKQGFYVYVGSAKTNLQRRIERHKRRIKQKRWHIDYLTEWSRMVADLPIRSTKVSECELAGLIKRLADSQVLGFGSSDCYCSSHLFYFKDNPLISKDFVYLITNLRLGMG